MWWDDLTTTGRVFVCLLMPIIVPIWLLLMALGGIYIGINVLSEGSEDVLCYLRRERERRLAKRREAGGGE